MTTKTATIYGARRRLESGEFRESVRHQQKRGRKAVDLNVVWTVTEVPKEAPG